MAAMTQPPAEAPVAFTEENVPVAGIGDAVDELIDLYGGEVRERRDHGRTFVMPLRRGVAAGGAVECSISWTAGEGDSATVTLSCDRNVDAPRAQRILLLVAGVAGALLFTIWPFFPQSFEFGALAWIGGAIAIAVYFLTLRRTSGGLAFDLLQRLVARQRAGDEEIEK